MENQHRQIKGYRELTQVEIDTMNRVKEQGITLGELVDYLKGDNISFDQRWVSIGATQLQQGLMALTRAIAKPTFFVLGLLFLGGCSHGLQEVSFAVHDDQDGAHYIVTRDVVSSRVTAGQPHTAGQFHCTGKYTSEEMASLRASYGEHTWYKDCTPTEYLPMHKYVLTSDQPIASLYSSPVSAAVLSMGFGAGLAFSGSKITQNGGGASSSSGSIGIGSANSSSSSSNFVYDKAGNVGHHKW